MSRRLLAWLLLVSVLAVTGCATGPSAPTAGAPPAPTAGPVELIVKQRGGPASFDPRLAAEDVLIAAFAGHDRKVAKTSIVAASIPVEEFETLDELLESLPSDQEMIEQNISKDADSDRVDNELRMVRVKKAWLYAVKLEDDQDFHLIVGTSPGAQTSAFLNCEVSGLPEENSPGFTRLKAVRQQLFDILGKFPGKKYARPTPPLPIEIAGSLFFDVDHAAGTVGPHPFRPATAWEIHPITSLKRR